MTIQWPNPLDYNDAVQCPELAFEDPELQTGEVELTPLGLPKVATGNFASVYRFDCGGKAYAVKCFLRNVFDQHRRYAHLTQFTTTTNVEYMVDFEYQLKGIAIEENWFPIVKMEWVDGLTLDQFVRKHWSNKAQIDRVMNQFVELVARLKELGIAHCDLQHGNILVKDDSIRLVDYDGMFVPAMAGQQAAELGHSNFQHPQRSDNNFDARLDDFSAWIIYYSLFFLKLDSALWQRFEGGDDCLLFKKADFTNPDNSRLLREIRDHAVPDIKDKFEAVNTLLHLPLAEIPAFGLGPQAPTGSPQSLVSTNDLSSDSIVKPAPVYPERWPTIEQYFHAALRPTKSYSDEKLQRAVPVPTQGRTSSHIEVDSTTQERLTVAKTVIHGRNHMVLHLVGEAGARHYAVKLFLHNVADRHIRYNAIHKHQKKNSNRYFVPFVYQKHGIQLGEVWFPLLKMLWVQGDNLEEYVRKQVQIGNAGALDELLPKFVSMIKSLSEDGIAHGDLEPANIIVDESGELKIVDYDSMYVPALASLQGCETGHKTYQHPSRNLTNYGNYLDNFASLAIYGILACMTRNPPERFWRWETLLQHVRSQQPHLKQDRSLTQRKTPFDSSSMPKQHDRASVTGSLGMGNPLFEKASYEDLRAAKTFDNSMQKMVRVLSNQRKRRIDQVSKLDLSMWDLA